MKKRFLSLIMTFVLCLGMLFPAFAADDTFLFSYDYNERYTDISEIADEQYKNYVAGTTAEKAAGDTRRNIYITVLSVLLVVAIVVLVVTLKRSHDEQLEEAAEDEAEELSKIRKVNLKSKEPDELIKDKSEIIKEENSKDE